MRIFAALALAYAFATANATLRPLGIGSYRVIDPGPGPDEPIEPEATR